MRKKISEMTATDKEEFLNHTKLILEKQYHIPWKFIELQALHELDKTFDDKKFAKMRSYDRIDAENARKEFGDKKPELVDYLMWVGKKATHSECVEW